MRSVLLELPTPLGWPQAPFPALLGHADPAGPYACHVVPKSPGGEVARSAVGAVPVSTEVAEIGMAGVPGADDLVDALQDFNIHFIVRLHFLPGPLVPGHAFKPHALALMGQLLANAQADREIVQAVGGEGELASEDFEGIYGVVGVRGAQPGQENVGVNMLLIKPITVMGNNNVSLFILFIERPDELLAGLVGPAVPVEVIKTQNVDLFLTLPTPGNGADHFVMDDLEDGCIVPTPSVPKYGKKFQIVDKHTGFLGYRPLWLDLWSRKPHYAYNVTQYGISCQ